MNRFWTKVNKTDGCWIWLAYKNTRGYGKFSFKGKSCLAHRVAWIMSNGEIEDSLCICHACDNPSCVRPDHLFLGTQSENHADMVAKGRNVRPIGTKHHLHRFTDEQVRLIRQEFKKRPCVHCLSRQYKVSTGAISGIVYRNNWKHI